jgi:hypothetical protein
MSRQAAEQLAQQRLANIKAPWITGIAGLSIIVVGFLISIINASVDTPSVFISMTLQPFIFVGLGLLLYHVGQHVHAMNQNAILMVKGVGSAEHDAPSPGVS